MQLLLVAAVLVGGCALALAGADRLLAIIGRCLAGPQVLIQRRAFIFCVALFWFWYFAPSLAAHVNESDAIASLVHALTP